MEEIVLDISYDLAIMKLEASEKIKNSICIRSDYEDILKCLKSRCSIGIQDEKLGIVACSLAYYTEYGTAYIEKCFVHPNFRGKGLQRQMLGYNIELLKGFGVCEIFTMVSPLNKISEKNFNERGFKLKREIMYNGVIRNILKYEADN